ncbi:Hypothetical predicted protein [Olea europaea subsp. europaea]|uniref:Uncharacterized protein n=1 Tax=Olea europaea subsp. europaea TaxID=158383 RepID=A0A8S0PMK7_OLEEU|nr:Hypothetical predicted protein [Olea europaea subsp. europaea]
MAIPNSSAPLLDDDIVRGSIDFKGRPVYRSRSGCWKSAFFIIGTFRGSGGLRAECLADPFIDVKYVGAVCLKVHKTDLILLEESLTNIRVYYEEFRTDVITLFIVIHNGNVALETKLLSVGADVSQQLFKGFATTEAVRDGHLEILEILVKDGASQPACEEALLEASFHGQEKFVEMLMGSDLIRLHIAIHALIIASCRGFVDLLDALLKVKVYSRWPM